ncbi:MAG: cell division protein ZapA [Bacteroidetes bacterium]|nr:cell division protein ZapA [Bacteroidota bacterium]
MADNISIKVNVGDRIYPLQIIAREEEYVRKAAKLLNERITFFNNSFTTKDRIDGLAMAALEYAIDALNKTKKVEAVANTVFDFSPINNELTEIESLL